MHPYLNKRAKALLAQCDLEITGNYVAINEFFLHEMRLYPSVYWEKFNTLTPEHLRLFSSLQPD